MNVSFLYFGDVILPHKVYCFFTVKSRSQVSYHPSVYRVKVDVQDSLCKVLCWSTEVK